MASLKDLRRRINSVKNTQKITKAQKLVSVAKFARANTAVVNARPYGQAFQQMVQKLVRAAGEDVKHPLLEQRPEGKALIAVLSTDRGFCGSLNTNLFKTTLQFVAGKREQGVEIGLMTWGKRARLFANKLRYPVIKPREKVLDKPSYEVAKELARDLVHEFTEGGYDRVYVAFVEFRSAMSQLPKVVQILPFTTQVAEAAKGTTTEADVNRDVIVEPAAVEMLGRLLMREVATTLFRLMLEGAASEHGARMTAMDSATNNASKVLKRIKIEYNRARQAAITKELIEITSGAQAI